MTEAKFPPKISDTTTTPFSDLSLCMCSTCLPCVHVHVPCPRSMSMPCSTPTENRTHTHTMIEKPHAFAVETGAKGSSSFLTPKDLGMPKDRHRPPNALQIALPPRPPPS